ncbi:MAG: hypothetical protein PW734_03940 [Verrucomicrobium sp.]|nr:hypothetical protein [Verrucomicrobium sp.]
MDFQELRDRIIERTGHDQAGEEAVWKRHVNVIDGQVLLGGWVGPGARVDAGAFLDEEAAVFGEGTAIGPGTALGEGVLVGPGVVTTGDVPIEGGAYVSGQHPRGGVRLMEVQHSRIQGGKVLATDVIHSQVLSGAWVEDSRLVGATVAGPGTVLLQARVEGGEVSGGAWLSRCRVGQEGRIDTPVVLQGETVEDDRYARERFEPVAEDEAPFRRAEQVMAEADRGPAPTRWIN